MSDVTRILSAIDQGDPSATEQLLPLVYEELRRLAAQKLAQEKPGQTLQATALVHEAYLRLVGSQHQDWDNRGHFFAAAAKAMRRILIEQALRRTMPHEGGICVENRAIRGKGNRRAARGRTYLLMVERLRLLHEVADVPYCCRARWQHEVPRSGLRRET